MIPCPIGQSEVWDVLPAANREVMASLNYFIVENTRSARRFLSKAKLGLVIDNLRFEELNEHTKAEELEMLIAPLLEGVSAGVISEAGVPGIADPGADIVALCHRKGIEVVPLVGPSSLLLALMSSGMNGQSFAFNGYLPIKGAERSKAVKHFERRAVSEHQSQIFIETPYRNDKLLEDFISLLSDNTRLCVASDIMESSQYIRTMTIAQWRKTQKPSLSKRPTVFIIGI